MFSFILFFFFETTTNLTNKLLALMFFLVAFFCTMVTKKMVVQIQQRKSSLSHQESMFLKTLVTICLINGGCKTMFSLTYLLVGLPNLIPYHLFMTTALCFNLPTILQTFNG
jgi:hypothetical protein